MKTRIHISFNEGKERYSFVRDLLEGIGCVHGLCGQDHILCGLYQHTFDMEDPMLDLLRQALEALERESIKWSEHIEYIFTVGELRAAPLLCLTVNRKSIDSGIEYGITYDLSSACPRCGTGAVQMSPLMVRRSELPRKGVLVETHVGETLLRDELADAWRDAAVSGVELRQARFWRNQEPLPWWQIISTYEMPRMSTATKGIIQGNPPPCTFCLRDGHYHTCKQPPEIIYDRCEVNPESLPDVVHTWECFGRSLIADDPVRDLVQGFAQPLILVKSKVFNIFHKLKVRGARFEPVRFVD